MLAGWRLVRVGGGNGEKNLFTARVIFAVHSAANVNFPVERSRRMISNIRHSSLALRGAARGMGNSGSWLSTQRVGVVGLGLMGHGIAQV